MPGLFCSAAFFCRGAEKNRAKKRFRKRAISNRDFISISINHTALVVTCLIACQRCSSNLSADELISTVAPVVRYPMPLSGSRLLCMLSDRCLLMPVCSLQFSYSCLFPAPDSCCFGSGQCFAVSVPWRSACLLETF